MNIGLFFDLAGNKIKHFSFIAEGKHYEKANYPFPHLLSFRCFL